MSAKLAVVATLGLGAITLGSIYIFGYAGGMPSCRFLNEDSNATQTYSSGYAKDYLQYLVGVTKLNTHQEDSNDLWWEWVFANRYQKEKESFDGGFKNLTSGSKEGESIKKACEKAYKGNLNNGNITENQITYKESDLWKLCSPLNKKP